jgi:hypothetical protein
LFSDCRIGIDETIGNVGKYLIVDRSRLQMLGKVFQLYPNANQLGPQITSEEKLNTITCCNNRARVALSSDENNFTTHGTIFFSGIYPQTASFQAA